MKGKILLVVIIIFLNNSLQAQTWDGSSSTDWHTAANWSTNTVPISTGAVIIPGVGITNWPVIANNITIGRITMNSGSQLNTGGFNITLTTTGAGGGCDITGAIVTNPVGANTTLITCPGGGSNYNGSTFNGNFHFSNTSPNQTTNEATTAANTWNGNVTFTCFAGETMSIATGFASTFNGNLSISKPLDATGAAGGNLLFAGPVITGNFTLNFDDESVLRVGSITNITRVSGQVNITIENSGFGITLLGLRNQTTGGAITINNLDGDSNMDEDSLVVTSISIAQTVGDLLVSDSYIKANLTYNCTSANGNDFLVLSNCFFDGNVSCTSGISDLIEGNSAACTYTGNASFTSNGGAVTLGNTDTSSFHRDVTVNANTGLNIKGLKFIGSTNSTFTQLGTQAISIGRIIMNKTGSGGLTLNCPVSITTSVRFTSGNIYTTATNYLRFNNNIGYTEGGVASHVVGTVEKVGGLSLAAPFTFPTGTTISYNPITKSNSATATDLYSAEYVMQNPSINGLNTNNKAGTLTNISKAGYWNVQRLVGIANVTLTLGFAANPYEQYPVIANLKVAHWNGSQWDDKGTTSPTGGPTLGSITNSIGLTAYGFFALANMTATYFYDYSNPGTGPDGTPVKIKGIGGWSSYQTKQLPAGVYNADSIYLIPNATAASFKLKDFYNVEKDDTIITTPTAPVTYISANGNGTVNFTGWRHFVYMTDGSNKIMGAIKDNDLTLGNTTMTTYFSTANVATAPNGNIFLKRSFKITSQFAPVGIRRIRFYISKTEYNNLVAADPSSFPNGINSLTITKYTGPQEDSLFNPIPGGNAVIIPNSDITIADLGTMYSLDIDVTGFSGFYISGTQSDLSLCSGSTISVPSNISGATYQWQVDNGGGYVNISNGGVYSGVTTSSVTITNAPSNMYGYKLRCVVNGGTFSQEYTIKFTSLWEGTVNDAWENTANWSCGVLPDANTDVILSAGKPNFPQVNSNVTIRTLKLNSGSSATVKTGFTLTVIK